MRDRLLDSAGSALIWQGLNIFGAKFIFFVRLLILARLLSPDDFGLLAIAVSTIGIFLSLTNVGMIPALVQGEDVEDKDYDTAWTVGVARAALITGIVFIGAPLIAEIFAEPRAVPIIQALAFRPLLDSLISIRTADLTRKLDFQPLAIIKLSEAIINLVVSVLLATAYGVWALVAGVLAGATVGLVLSYVFAPYRPRISVDRSSAQSLIRFGRWIFVNSLIAMAGANLLRISISRNLGTAELGLYFLATQFAFLPSEIASDLVGAVTFPLFSRLQLNIDRLTRAFKMTLTGMAALLYPMSVLLIALTPTFIEVALGPEWSGTEPVIRILALSTMIGLFGDAAIPLLKGVGLPQRETVINTAMYSALILFVWAFSTQLGVVGVALAWLPAVTLAQIITAIFIRRVLHRPFKALPAPMFAVLTSAVLAAGAALAVVQLVTGIIGLVASVLFGLGVYAAILLIAERRFSLGLTEDLNQIYPKSASRLGLNLSSTGN